MGIKRKFAIAGAIAALAIGGVVFGASKMDRGLRIVDANWSMINASMCQRTITREDTEVEGTNYTDWTIDPMYKGQSAGGNDSIQLRSSKSSSGIVTVVSVGPCRKVSVIWNSNTDTARNLDIYGKNTAYTAPSDLYDNATKGTKIGTLNYGKGDTELEINNNDYTYIGVRSNSGALWLTSITFDWYKGV